MKKIQYKTIKGEMQWRPVFTTARNFQTASIRGTGFCLACGKTQTFVEPDARKYPCNSCDKPKVYGLEELMLMGLMK